MQDSPKTYRQKVFRPLRDYLGFVSGKELNVESQQLERVEGFIKRYYWVESDFDYFFKKEGLSLEKAQDNQLSAAALRFLSLNNTKTKVRALALKGVETVKQLAELVQKSTVYCLKISSGLLSIKRLLTKAKEFLKAKFSLGFLIHKNKGNDHASKAWTDDAKDVLLSLYANPGSDVKPLESKVFKDYNELVKGERTFVNPVTGEVISNESKDLPVIKSKTTLWNFFSNEWVKRVTAKLRDGDKYYNDHYKPYVKRQKPNYALSFVSSDGQVIPFRLKIKGVDTYKRALCYFIFDVKTGAIIGYSIGRTETKALMAEAFGNMLINTKGVKPHEVQLDNFGKSYLKELEQIFPQVSFCKPLSPQSKYAERFIADFERKYCRNVDGWTGSNITAKNKRNNHRRNPDKKQECYEITKIKAMYARFIADYNKEILEGTSGQTRMEVLEQNINPGCKQIEETTLASLFGKTTFSSIQRGYVKIAVDSKDYYFKVSNANKIGAQQKNGKSVRVRYLPYKLNEKVWLYNYDKYDKMNFKTDTYLTDAVKPSLPQAAEAEQVHEDLVAMGEASRWVAETEASDDADAANIAPLVDPDAVMEWDNDYEAIISAGYTEKGLMQEAEEQVIAVMEAPHKSKLKKKKKTTKSNSANRWNSWANQ